ncbi:hypothetical protein DVH05_005211, partial [Phytophthora capsici]
KGIRQAKNATEAVIFSTYMYVCNMCTLLHSQREQVDHYRHSVVDSPFKCLLCPKAYEIKKTLIKHIRLKYPAGSGSLREARVCNTVDYSEDEAKSEEDAASDKGSAALSRENSDPESYYESGSASEREDDGETAS